MGLFVHSHNEPAIHFYESSGYEVNTILISKEPNAHHVELSQDMVLEMESLDDAFEIGIKKFAKIVRSTQNISDKEIQDKYQEYLSRYKNDDDHQCLKIRTKDGAIAGYVWIGKAYFNDMIAMIYDFSVKQEYTSDKIGQILFKSAEKWVKIMIIQGFTFFFIHLMRFH